MDNFDFITDFTFEAVWPLIIAGLIGCFVLFRIRKFFLSVLLALSLAAVAAFVILS